MSFNGIAMGCHETDFRGVPRNIHDIAMKTPHGSTMEGPMAVPPNRHCRVMPHLALNLALSLSLTLSPRQCTLEASRGGDVAHAVAHAVARTMVLP